MNDIDETEFSEQDIISCLRGNQPTTKYCFIAKRSIYQWHPDTGHLTANLIEIEELAQACLEYLRKAGKEYPSLEEARKAAMRDNWPRWEEMPVTRR
jgi:hypothetical protein